MRFADEVKAALEMLGGSERDPVVDFLADPGRAARALDALAEGDGLVLRAAPALGAAVAGYGPVPADPVWLRVMRGAREIGQAALRGGSGQVRRAIKVELDEEEIACCDAPSCDRKRLCAAAWLVLEGAEKRAPKERFLIAEQRLLAGEGRAPDAVQTVASKLAKALGVPLERGGESIEVEETDIEPLAEAPDRLRLARFALRSEGARVVLRDLASVGPRETAKRNGLIGGALMLIALALWLQLLRARGLGASTGTLIAYGVAAALLSLTGYAFVGVARFSGKYNARSNPLAAVGRDKLIVSPWVGRDGAVDERPEGRLGAAIPLGEVRLASVKRRGALSTIEIDTDHGAIDALRCDDEATARLFCAALNRAIDEARHPRAGASARQRARAKAQTQEG